MKTLIGMILFVGLTGGAFNSADAQRARDNSSRGGRESNTAPQRESRSNFSENRSFRQNTVSRNNSYTPVQRNVRTYTPNNAINNRVYTQRNAITRNNVRVNNNVSAIRPDNAIVSSGFNRNRIATPGTNSYYPNRSNNYRYNNSNYRYNNYYHYNSSYYGGGYYSYNNRRYSFMYGNRFSVLPRGYLSISFGGYPYYYNDGFYYGYYGGYYQPIFPPFGLRIGVLPYGYYSFYLGGYPYYYYNGIYYQQYDNSYQVVDAPMGATVYNLPQGAKAVVLNGETLYELNGMYYKEGLDSKGQTIYTVVGKNGEVNNTDNNTDLNAPNNNLNTPNNNLNAPDNNLNNNDNSNNDNNLNTPPAASLQLGDIVTQLPEGSRVVTINGEKMYVSPDNTYLKEEADGGVVQYKVVGK